MVQHDVTDFVSDGKDAPCRRLESIDDDKAKAAFVMDRHAGKVGLARKRPGDNLNLKTLRDGRKMGWCKEWVGPFPSVSNSHGADFIRCIVPFSHPAYDLTNVRWNGWIIYG
ncbi:MAG TPA: hypothetical protein VNL16_06430 [Chloroflexota bacterium]|nr:hypothetical protein [Chloroflexota bacterium]